MSKRFWNLFLFYFYFFFGGGALNLQPSTGFGVWDLGRRASSNISEVILTWPEGGGCSRDIDPQPLTNKSRTHDVPQKKFISSIFDALCLNIQALDIR